LKRFLVVGPNGGASFGGGGGSFVAIKIAETLSKLPNSQVGLVSLWGARPEVFEKIFGVALSTSRVKHFSLLTSGTGHELPIGAMTTPYLAAVLMGATRFLERTMERFKPDLVVFNDDSPTLSSIFETRNVRSLLYSHFPYACRVKYRNKMLETSSVLRRMSEMLVMPFMARLFEMDRLWVDWPVANSSVTKKYMSGTFNNREITTIFPPVNAFPYKLPQKSNIVISVGGIQPNKKFEEVIQAMSKVKTDCKCFIIGNLRDVTYFRSLVRQVRNLGLERQVHILPEAPRQTLLSLLGRSKLIIHASRFEPFGISVVEGMNAGAVPIVCASENGGPWVDIVSKGRYGLGYDGYESLADQIDSLMDDEAGWREHSAIARARGAFFSAPAFSNSILQRIGVDELLNGGETLLTE
jgi:glycosyltransferase involved in cell wall biosynthesis